MSEQLKFGLRKPLEMNMGSVDNIDFVSYNMTWFNVEVMIDIHLLNVSYYDL